MDAAARKPFGLNPIGKRASSKPFACYRTTRWTPRPLPEQGRPVPSARSHHGHLRASYSGSTEDLAPYHHAISVGATKATFTLTCTPPPPTVSCGRTDGIAGNGADPSDPIPKARERIRHVYLPALRDAVRDLGSSTATGVQMIIESLIAVEVAIGNTRETLRSLW